jgi:hypothetical protein
LAIIDLHGDRRGSDTARAGLISMATPQDHAKATQRYERPGGKTGASRMTSS